jgi:hypothetical protein
MIVRAPTIRAFSLVEVLVAVLVLALGLLGLGAVFPVVVRQQRIATETTLGVSAMEAVASILEGNENFRDRGPAWPALRSLVQNQGKHGEWVPVVPHPDTGNYNLPGGVVLPLSQRLYPLPFSAEAQPRFVWDISARIADPQGPSSPMIVAVFLRPIDPGIRLGRYKDSRGVMVPYSLTTTLLGQVPANDQRYPLSVDRDGRPTFDGRRDNARYATAIVATVGGPGVNTLNMCSFEKVVSSGTDRVVAVQLLGAPGQRFLDRRGNVYRVTEVYSNHGEYVIGFEPSFPDPDGNGRFDPDDVNPILYLPQPSAVDPLIFTVSP